MQATEQTLRRIFTQHKSIAVVGMSVRPERASHYVPLYMQAHGYRITPINPIYAVQADGSPGMILGERCYATLAEVPHAIDMVNVFRRTEDVLPVAQDALAIGAHCLWQQLDIENTEADALFRAANRDSVMNLCLKVAHAQMFGHAI
jgi:uncharacterized protein